MMKKNPIGRKEIFSQTTFGSELEKAIGNLTYISETDAEIVPFFVVCGKTEIPIGLLNQTLGQASDATVEESGFDEFFGRLTRVYENSNELAKSAAGRFANLRDFLRSNLSGLTVFKFGSIQTDILVVGLDPEGNIRGIRTRGVET